METKIENRPVECDNCAWDGTEQQLRADLSETEDLAKRIDPGCEVPAGECPDCGALAYLIKKEGSIGVACLVRKTPEAEIQPNYYVLHHHKYGVSVWLVRSDHVPSEQEVCAAIPDLASNYEPETGNEWLDIESIGLADEVFAVPPKADADLADTLRRQGRGIPDSPQS